MTSTVRTVETIVLKSIVPPTCNAFSDSQYAIIKLYIPVGTKEAYMKAEPWKNFFQ